MLAFLDALDGWLYYPVLIIVLLAAGIFFSFKTRFVQLRLFGEAIRVISEKPHEGGISSFKALMVSTASRVGTGNIVGVATAICLGGFGAAMWMWIIALIGMASAFVESTLAQIYKRVIRTVQATAAPRTTLRMRCITAALPAPLRFSS